MTINKNKPAKIHTNNTGYTTETKISELKKQINFYKEQARKAGIIRLRETEIQSKLIKEHKLAKVELQNHRIHLEDLVNQRTRELQTAINESEQLNRQLQEEIKVREKAESKIKQSLYEKKLLLKEIHHRVKNNLQIIHSLLNLQRRNLPDENSKSIFKESQNRIQTMALIHEDLYQSDNFSIIDAKYYINKLVNYLQMSYGDYCFDIQLNIDAINFNIDLGIYCGLILNELISNAVKYANNNNSLIITITLKEQNKNSYLLIITDNGRGLPADFNINNNDTLGMQLINGLVNKQLEGTLKMNSSSKGTTWTITFDQKNNEKHYYPSNDIEDVNP